jgi:hypothetical protein
LIQHKAQGVAGADGLQAAGVVESDRAITLALRVLQGRSARFARFVEVHGRSSAICIVR